VERSWFRPTSATQLFGDAEDDQREASFETFVGLCEELFAGGVGVWVCVGVDAPGAS